MRLRDFACGAGHIYAVTFCTADRSPFLTQVDREGVIEETAAGRAVRMEWDALSARYPGVVLELSVVMPDHLHAILAIEPHPTGPAVVLSDVMRAWKSRAAITIDRDRGLAGVAVWQRSVHDRVIRNEAEHERLLADVLDNPIRWAAERLRESDG